VTTKYKLIHSDAFFLSVCLCRHIQSNTQPPQAPVPPLGYVSGNLISDLETDVPDDDEDDIE